MSDRIHDECGQPWAAHEYRYDPGPKNRAVHASVVCPDDPEHSSYIDPHHDRPRGHALSDDPEEDP